MPRIHTVAQDGLITAGDKLIGSDGAQNNNFATRNYTVGGISNFVLDGTHAGSFTTITSSGNGTIGADLSVAGNLAVTGNATISGNLTFGDANTDTVAFGADIVSHIIPDVTDTYDLGASDKIWRNIYVNNITGIGNLQLGDAATDAASEIKAYGDLELKADSDNDNGYAIGVELFRTRFSNQGGIGLSINRNQYDSSMNLLANSIFETLQVGDVVHGFGNYGNYPNVTSAAITQIRGWYDGSNNLLSAIDGNGQALPETLGNPPAGAVELKIYLNASISYSNSALLTILPAGQALVSNSNNKSIKFYQGTTSIGTLNASSFVIPGKATIGGFTIPNTIGSAGETLLVPSSGSELEWGSGVDPLEIGPHVAVGQGGDEAYTIYNNNAVLSRNTQDYGLSIINTPLNNSGNTSLILGNSDQMDGVQMGYNVGAYTKEFTINMRGIQFMNLADHGGKAISLKQNTNIDTDKGFTAGNGTGTVTFVNAPSIGPSNDRYQLVGGRPSSDNQFLKYTTNGVTEWAPAVGVPHIINATHNTNSLSIGYSAWAGGGPQSGDGGAIENVAVGIGAMNNIFQGDGNVSVGYNANAGLNFGDFNIAIGHKAGASTDSSAVNLTTGDRNILIGANIGVTNGGTFNAIVIGTHHDVDDGDGIVAISHQTIIGNDQTNNAIVKGLRQEVRTSPATDTLSDVRGTDANKITVLDSTSAITITLPDHATDSAGNNVELGKTYTFVVKTAATGGDIHKIVCANTATQKIIGTWVMAGNASFAYESNNYSAINMDGTTKGGGVGTIFSLTCIADGLWLINNAAIIMSGSVSSPFSTS
jgi:hypothetical protein